MRRRVALPLRLVLALAFLAAVFVFAGAPPGRAAAPVGRAPVAGGPAAPHAGPAEGASGAEKAGQAEQAAGADRTGRPPWRRKTFMVRMSDGVRLATDVVLPPVGSGPWPAVLSRTPYGRNKMGGASLVAALLGYAAVTQDMRGRFDSEGENLPFIGCGWEPYLHRLRLGALPRRGRDGRLDPPAALVQRQGGDAGRLGGRYHAEPDGRGGPGGPGVPIHRGRRRQPLHRRGLPGRGPQEGAGRELDPLEPFRPAGDGPLAGAPDVRRLLAALRLHQPGRPDDLPGRPRGRLVRHVLPGDHRRVRRPAVSRGWGRGRTGASVGPARASCGFRGPPRRRNTTCGSGSPTG